MKIASILVLLPFIFSPIPILAQTPTPPINLHLAALQGNLELIDKGIEGEVDLNQKDQYGSTPLIIATTFGRNEAVHASIDAETTSIQRLFAVHNTACYSPEKMKGKRIQSFPINYPR